MKYCSECHHKIHPQRLAAMPGAKTCKTKCSLKRQRKRRIRNAVKWNKKNRKARSSKVPVLPEKK